MTQLSHFDAVGGSRIVDVGDKPVTVRRAPASGRVRMAADTLPMVKQAKAAQGDVLEVARLAGIVAAKRAGERIPLRHVLPLDGVSLSFRFSDAATIVIDTEARDTAQTGVEMEPPVAVGVAA